jgi:hypothetical protein
MPISRRGVAGFFDKKLAGAEQVRGRRHTGYRIATDRGVLLLPLLTVSRGSGGDDIDAKNAKGLADNMGLSLEGFIEGCRCTLRADVVTFCAAVRVVLHCNEMYRLDGITYNIDWIRSISNVVQRWLEVTQRPSAIKPTDSESREISRAIRRLTSPELNTEPFKPIADHLVSISERRFAK